ncbi:MAG: multiprotein bridging factor aMBF1 [Candidatus Bathyarchaeia archaeon]
MRCEVCGGRIHGKPKKVVIEGARMLVCEECAKHGSIYSERRIKSPISGYVPVKRKKKTVPAITLSTRRKAPSLPEDLEIKEGFGSLVRKARENIGLSQEDLGKKIGEKVSVLKKIESEKMIPDQKLAKKLEHTLKVELLVPSGDYEIVEDISSPPPSGVTLGEIAQLKTEKRRHPATREQ